ncbi:hypothetical protein LS77_009630 [Helicobacter bilis]|uniref:Uncharacterized protein n=2 Tax=Helicobacter bilis TaxID=37372 RepID=A0A6D2C5N0_9HELI|nr:hypothetical protein [Helicobacter bilis]EMZ41027.1 hypothetical protein C826_00032 [Helicobacter bilis WiWa]TLE03034.1 hypothetical protein LS77_009630 [Helicobacter bilis]TLE03779.1 hypothetical protein LS76_009775 [Helicobacter bilis]
MENKLLINKMKNAAELAWAAYGYYDLVANDTNLLFIKLKNEKENNEANSDEISLKKKLILPTLWIAHLQIMKCINHNYHQS